MSRASLHTTGSLNVKKYAITALRSTTHHLRNHVGVGIICSIAYFDPGNWGVDLQAGSDFGYRPMLFVILMAGVGAMVLQSLATRLGCVTGLDLASHCRLLLYNRTRRPRLVRYLALYPLYVLSEIAIISTDLAELLGSAIGICLIFPKLPLYAGVLITAADIIVFLMISDPYSGHGKPVRSFELVIMCLVFAVFGCFVALLAKSRLDWGQVFMGYIPNKDLVKEEPDAVYAIVGILGATIMPHALFLGSSLATLNRVSSDTLETTYDRPAQRSFISTIRRYLKTLFGISSAERISSSVDYRSRYGERENNTFSFIQKHLVHGIVDVVTSLLFIAVPINSAILVIAASIFHHHGHSKGSSKSTVGLFDAHALIKSHLGSGAAFVFALALVCAGQTSSITVTLSGQLVSEGFIEWQMSPFLRRLLTRLISLIPSVIVAASTGRNGVNTLLVASQVVLSVVLPFVAFPLIYLTSSEKVMRVRRPIPISIPISPPPYENDGMKMEDIQEVRVQDINIPPPSPSPPPPSPSPPPSTLQSHSDGIRDLPMISIPIPNDVDVEKTNRESIKQESTNDFIDFSNHKFVAWLAYAIWSIVLVANGYVIATLAVRSSS